MRYPGGKGGCFRHIVNLMPPHEVYIETHLGGGNVLEQKRPAGVSIGVDIDPEVIGAWRARRRSLSFPVELYCCDAVAFLRGYAFSGRELVYADPPYLPATRRALNLYRHEYSEAQHVELLGVLVTIPCAVMISGYDSEIYRDVLQTSHGWRVRRFDSMTRHGMRVESVWFNFAPGALHDTRYVGESFRKREQLKRKKQRWRQRLAAMSPAERQAILETLLELASPGAAMRDLLAVPGDARSVAAKVA